MSSRFDPIALRHCAWVTLVLAGMIALALFLLDTPFAYPGSYHGVAETGLQKLRLRAAGGDWPANRSLTRLLLDRFDALHNSDDLFEAMLWLDMDWDSPTAEHFALQERIYKRYCQHKVLRWHWICNPVE